MLTTHRIALDPNDRQATLLSKTAGCAKKAYNLGLDIWKSQYEAHRADPSKPKPGWISVNNEFNARKRKLCPYVLETSSRVTIMAIRHLGRAYSNFFAGRAKYPRHKGKYARAAFTLPGEVVKVCGKGVAIPRIGTVRMRQRLRFEGTVKTATVSRSAGKWFASMTVEVADDPPGNAVNNETVGIDLGIETMATLSTGEKIPGPRPLKRLLGHLRRCSKSVSRKQKGSKRRTKAVWRLAKAQAKIANVRNDAIHKATTSIVRRFGTVAIEDLNVKGMMATKRTKPKPKDGNDRNAKKPKKETRRRKPRGFTRAAADMGWGQFRRQLEYKVARANGVLKAIDRFYPSSKTCSECGHKLDKLPLKTRRWECPGCGAEHDRDVNASKNIRNTAAGVAVAARGGEGSGAAGMRGAKPSPRKREAASAGKTGRIGTAKKTVYKEAHDHV
jgi:putative transposase